MKPEERPARAWIRLTQALLCIGACEAVFGESWRYVLLAFFS
jgi:hypothetical protein